MLAPSSSDDSNYSQSGIMQYSEWFEEPGVAQILDFKILLAAVPPWLQTYSTASEGCGHRIVATMKAEGSRSKYVAFIRDLRSLLSPTQCKSLGKVFLSFEKPLSINPF